jgi:HSP20 family protein
MAKILIICNKKLYIMITLFKDPFFEAIDRVLDTPRFNTPQTNIRKTDNEYELSISVPGLTKDDLKILTKEGILKITFEKSDENTNPFVSNFTKSYNIPDDVKEKDIVGKVENGVLTLTLPIDKKKALERLISLN